MRPKVLKKLFGRKNTCMINPKVEKIYKSYRETRRRRIKTKERMASNLRPLGIVQVPSNISKSGSKVYESLGKRARHPIKCQGCEEEHLNRDYPQ